MAGKRKIKSKEHWLIEGTTETDWVNDTNHETKPCCCEKIKQPIVKIVNLKNWKTCEAKFVCLECATRFLRGYDGKVRKKQSCEVRDLCFTAYQATKWLESGIDIHSVRLGLLRYEYKVDMSGLENKIFLLCSDNYKAVIHIPER